MYCLLFFEFVKSPVVEIGFVIKEDIIGLCFYDFYCETCCLFGSGAEALSYVMIGVLNDVSDIK